MDPISQGAVGAAFAQAAGNPVTGRKIQSGKAAVAGALAGMAADLDVLIRSSDDPLLFLEYHRQFTHSLFFIPIGGLLCGWLFYVLFRRRWELGLGECLFWATVGYATHGLLDGFTSYGTQLLWPLTDHRFSWDIVSVVDPLFTLPLLLFVFSAGVSGRQRYAWFGIGWISLYLLLGFIQQERARDLGYALAVKRGHPVERLEAKPSFANIVVWKTLYESGDQFYVDAVKPGLGEGKTWRGGSVTRLNLERDFPWLREDSQQARDVARFDWFSQGFTAVHPDDPHRITDVRYSMLPQKIDGLWGIELSRNARNAEHVDYYTKREGGRAAAEQLWEMIWQ